MSTPHTFTLDDDLTDTQIYVTIQTYDRFSKKYGARWEWNPKTIHEIRTYNITPFCTYAKKGGTVLIAGSYHGRDYDLLTKKGFRCLGVDHSVGLLTEAIKRIPHGLFLRHDLQSLPFMPASFDAVYADALTSIPKKRIKETLKDFTIFLRSKGILYISVKLGTANVLELNDLGGKRYFALFRQEEIENLIKSIGLTMVWSEVSENTDPTLPKWFSLIAQKK